MANDYFQFKQFTVRQSRCAMKVGTDGTLLGAWARGGKRVLDIGTGTGLIALMMAQRYADARVVGIDIDAEAVVQARENVMSSPFVERIAIEHSDVKQYEAPLFDAIVSNPPYFIDSLESSDARRTLARHASTLTYADLMDCGWRLLTEDGEFSVIIPFDCKSHLEMEAVMRGFFKVREWAVKTTATKKPRRYLMAFRKHHAEFEKGEGIIGSGWYEELTKDFYI